MYKHAKASPPDKAPPAIDATSLFEESLDRFEEATQAHAMAVAQKDSKSANEFLDRKLRLRKALIEYVMALYKGDD